MNKRLAVLVVGALTLVAASASSADICTGNEDYCLRDQYDTRFALFLTESFQLSGKSPLGSGANFVGVMEIPPAVLSPPSPLGAESTLCPVSGDAVFVGEGPIPGEYVILMGIFSNCHCDGASVFFGEPTANPAKRTMYLVVDAAGNILDTQTPGNMSAIALRCAPGPTDVFLESSISPTGTPTTTAPSTPDVRVTNSAEP